LASEADEWVVSSSSSDIDSVIEVGCCSDIDEQGERFGCSYTNSTEEARSEELEKTSDVIKTELIFLSDFKHLWAGLVGNEVGLSFLGEETKSKPLLICDGALKTLGSEMDDDLDDFVVKSGKFFFIGVLLKLSLTGIFDGDVIIVFFLSKDIC